MGGFANWVVDVVGASVVVVAGSPDTTRMITLKMFSTSPSGLTYSA